MNLDLAHVFRGIVLAYVKDDISKGKYSNPGTWMNIVQLASIVRGTVVYDRLENSDSAL